MYKKTCLQSAKGVESESAVYIFREFNLEQFVAKICVPKGCLDKRYPSHVNTAETAYIFQQLSAPAAFVFCA